MRNWDVSRDKSSKCLFDFREKWGMTGGGVDRAWEGTLCKGNARSLRYVI